MFGSILLLQLKREHSRVALKDGKLEEIDKKALLKPVAIKLWVILSLNDQLYNINKRKS